MDELEGRGVAPEAPGERILATILFTDIVGSTATLQRLGDPAWRDLLLAHNARIREVINAYRGREVATTGDGFLVMFDGATRAVRCGAPWSARRYSADLTTGARCHRIVIDDQVPPSGPAAGHPETSSTEWPRRSEHARPAARAESGS